MLCLEAVHAEGWGWVLGPLWEYLGCLEAVHSRGSRRDSCSRTFFTSTYYFKQDDIHSQGPMPPMAFYVPKRNKKLEGGEEGEGKNVHLKTHATSKGRG